MLSVRHDNKATIGLIIFTVCTSHSVLVFPDDNTEYVEGETRYIWMPDGKGNPVLVDLHEPVNETSLRENNVSNSAYWLYTRENPTEPQVIIPGDIITVWYSHYQYDSPLKIIIHGWLNDGNTVMNALIKSAFLAVQRCNVIVVDWRELAHRNYPTAVAGVPSLGQFLGKFLMWLINNTGGNWNAVHLVGFSLGAHIAANAGKQVGGRIGRITGLDPAGPMWYTNNHALNRNNAQYVEVIHTDSHMLGMFKPIGDADFYPNGGRNPQPGCFLNTCSHRRSTELFASTVRYNHLVGRQCGSLQEAEICQCNGSYLRMGNAMITKRGRGLYCLWTGSKWPY